MRALRRIPRELAALLAVAGVIGVAWAMAMAPLQGPDEMTHLDYAQTLAETGKRPLWEPGGFKVSTEVATAVNALNLGPLVGVLSARPARTQLEIDRWHELSDQIGKAERTDGGASPLAHNPPLYYAYQAVPYLAVRTAGGDLLDRAIAMRIATVPFLLVIVACTWLLAVEVFGPRARLRATVATALVALWPMLGFMAGVINPDIALAAGLTAVLLAAVRLVKRGPSLRRLVVLCLLTALTILVHGRGLPAVGVLLVAVAIAAWRHRPSWRPLARWSVAGAAAAGAVLAVATVLAPSRGGGGLYGGEASFPGKSFSLKEFVAQTWQFYFDRLAFQPPRLGPDYGYRQVVVERFFGGVFGSLEIVHPEAVYDVIQWAIVAFVVVAWTAAVVRRDRVWRSWPVLLTVASLPAALMLLLHLASYRALLGSEEPLITGRYLLALAPVCALAVAWLVGVLPARWRAWAAGGAICLMLLLTFGSLGLTVIRFHA